MKRENVAGNAVSQPLRGSCSSMALRDYEEEISDSELAGLDLMDGLVKFEPDEQCQYVRTLDECRCGIMSGTD